jgi:hypothetical protein
MKNVVTNAKVDLQITGLFRINELDITVAKISLTPAWASLLLTLKQLRIICNNRLSSVMQRRVVW